MCLSREEQDSIRAMAVAVGETVELSQSLYNAVVQHDSSIPVSEGPVTFAHELDESPTRRALKVAPLPVFDDGPEIKS